MSVLQLQRPVNTTVNGKKVAGKRNGIKVTYFASNESNRKKDKAIVWEVIAIILRAYQQEKLTSP